MTKQIIVVYNGILFSYIEYANCMFLFDEKHEKNCFFCYAKGQALKLCVIWVLIISIIIINYDFLLENIMNLDWMIFFL